MVLAEDLKHATGRFLLGKGAEISETHLRVFKIWGIHSVLVEGSIDDLETTPAKEIDPEVLQAAGRLESRRFSHVDLNHPFFKELLRICTLRKAQKSPPPKASEWGEPFSLQEPAPDSAMKDTRPPLIEKVELQALLDHDINLASLPNIFNEISNVINDPRSSAVHVADVISKDTSLSAKLLKIVNSAFYSFPSEIDTISRAVTIVGTRQLSTLAMGASVITIFRDIPADLMDMESFWKHSITCGVCARIIASHKNINNTERLFVAGLLHDIGRIILYKFYPHLERECLMCARRSQKLLRNVEVEFHGCDHAQIGGMLHKKWNLPPTLEQAVTCHHDPLRSQYPLETSIICLADILANALEMGSSGERLVPSLKPEVWDVLRLEKDLLTKMTQLIDRQVAEVVHYFFGER
jgi:HD-like signal output (HDOD) protein